MTGGELVTDDGGTRDAQADADCLAGVVAAALVADELDLLDERLFRILVAVEVGDAVAVDVLASLGILDDSVRSGNDVAFLHLHADSCQSIIVQCCSPLCFDKTARCETEHVCDGTASAALTLCKVDLLRLIDGTMTEAALVSGFVQDHSVVHVVTGVRNDSNDCVGTVGEVVETVFVVKRSSDNRRLTSLQLVRFVVCAVLEGSTRRTHGLLTHLTSWKCVSMKMRRCGVFKTTYWYMLRGDWLKSEKGVWLATMERMLVGSYSRCVLSPETISGSVQAIDMKGCSKGPT